MNIDADLLLRVARSELAHIPCGAEAYGADLARADSWLSRMGSSAWRLRIHPHLDEARSTGNFAPVHYECRQVVRRWLEHREKYAPLPRHLSEGAPEGARPRIADTLHTALQEQAETRQKEAAAIDANSPQGHDAGGRQRWQEDAILRELRALGYDPRALPRPPAGKPGPKAEVRRKLPTLTQKVFKKAWERLRGFGDIADAA